MIRLISTSHVARKWTGCACLSLLLGGVFSCAASTNAPATAKPVPPSQQTFASANAAADALVAAAEAYNVPALKEILGPDGIDLIVTDDPVLDKNQATAWAAKAREKLVVVSDPKQPQTATLNVGLDDWPVPIPVVNEAGKWRFDSLAGRQEILYRRIGENELDAIELCQGYVEAQEEYASEKHDGARVNAYAQRIISTPGKHDGLAWRNADGTWGGPVGEGIARVIAEGYREKYQPFHGYYFKILKGQGPAAPLGKLDFVVQGAMIGGFALVAAPASYEVSGVKTFIVSHAGAVYEKDLGPKTLEQFSAMELFDPDKSWNVVEAP
ncbi:MAG TPA: DUF2950 domain-containing protein [Polyangiaceae bacterium]|nr:DUF2950 domain-containing protein [Polyangiaceae bacterium]